MWPRGDTGQGPGADMTSSRRTKNAGLSGFVSYMKRRDAEEALREFDGFEWGGSVLRVGWSKAVPVAAKPMFGKFSLASDFVQKRKYQREYLTFLFSQWRPVQGRAHIQEAATIAAQDVNAGTTTPDPAHLPVRVLPLVLETGITAVQAVTLAVVPTLPHVLRLHAVVGAIPGLVPHLGLDLAHTTVIRGQGRGRMRDAGADPRADTRARRATRTM